VHQIVDDLAWDNVGTLQNTLDKSLKGKSVPDGRRVKEAVAQLQAKSWVSPYRYSQKVRTRLL
jgi:hypothetical protein